MKDHTMNLDKITKKILLVLSLLSLNGCITPQAEKELGPALNLPFIKNTPQECYYLDEFMPVPDNMVAGKSGNLSLRYYTYKLANYKDWDKKHIILSFYSADDLCWSLFEEYYIQR